MNPYLEVILAGIIWGTSGIFVKILHLPATTVTFFRLSIPTIIVLVYLFYKHIPLFKHTNKVLIFASFVNALRMFFYFLAFTLTSVGNAVIMLYTWPLFLVIFSVIFLKETLSKKKIFLLILAFIGMILMFSNSSFSFKSNDIIGMISMLASSALYASTIPIFKKQLVHYSKIETIFYQNVVGAVVFLPFLFINRPFPTFSQASVASFYAFLIGLVGFFLFFAGLKKLRASTVSLLSYTEVFSAILFGWVFLQEGITINMVIGGILILVVSYFAKELD